MTKTVRTLLIGGTKHGEYMSFPEGQVEWELVESDLLAGLGYGPGDPRYVGNVYRRDDRLSRSLGFQVFTHAVLSEPESGGRYPQLLRAEFERTTSQSARLKQQDERIDGFVKLTEDLTDEIAEQESTMLDLERRLAMIRTLLEAVGVNVLLAAEQTGLGYGSALDTEDGV